MLRNFFVIGLPRSRTAWLANFLTYRNRFCYHEAMNGCRSMDEYKTKLGSDKGDSSTGLMLIDDFQSNFPDAKTIIIESEPQKSIKYAYKTYGVFDPALIYNMKSKMDLMKGWRIHIDEIDDKLPEIWAYLIGDGYDSERAELLKKFNIQIQNPYSMDIDAAMELFHA